VKNFLEVARKKFRTAIIIGGEGGDEFCAVRSCPTEAQAATDPDFRHYRIHLFSIYGEARAWALACKDCGEQVRKLDFHHFVKTLEWPDERCRLCRGLIAEDSPGYLNSYTHTSCLWKALTKNQPLLRDSFGPGAEEFGIQINFPNVAKRGEE
jgi:hypothetical protein